MKITSEWIIIKKLCYKLRGKFGLSIIFRFYTDEDVPFCGKFDFKKNMVYISLENMVSTYENLNENENWVGTFEQYVEIVIAHELGHASDRKNIEKVMQQSHFLKNEINCSQHLSQLRPLLKKIRKNYFLPEYIAWKHVEKFSTVEPELIQFVKIYDYKLKNITQSRIQTYLFNKLLSGGKLNLKIS